MAIGRVIVPFDSADRATREKYRQYAAGRHERTLTPHRAKRTLFTRHLVGTSKKILAQIRVDPAVTAVSELRAELPYEFHRGDYEQILHDIRHVIAPELGWQPAKAAPAP